MMLSAGGLLFFVLLLVLLIGGAWWLLLWKLKHDGAEPGGSWGRQFLGGRERTYGATVSLPGRPPEHVTVRYHSRGEAKRALRSMYGKRNVADIRVEDEAGAAGHG